MASNPLASPPPVESEIPNRSILTYQSPRRPYALAFLVLVVLALLNYLTLHDLANTQESSAITLNISGRQRMLSQQIALLSLQLADADEGAERNGLENDLLNAINQMGIAHILLTETDAEEATYLPLSPALLTAYFEKPTDLDSRVKGYVQLAGQVASTPSDQLTGTNPTLVNLLADAPVLLNALNDVVSIYQIESEAKVETIKQQILAFFVLTILVLILETLLIFRPMSLRLRAEMNRLQTEINMRRQAEAMLLQSESRYRAVIENQTELVCRYLPDGTLTFANEAYCQMFNQSYDTLVGSNLFDLLPSPEIIASIRANIATGAVTTHEESLVLPTGEVLWQEWIDTPIRDVHGQIIEFQAVGRDRTEVKQMELSLRESEFRYRLLVGNLPDVAILMFDHKLRYTLADGPYLERMGYVKDAMIGRTLEEIGAAPETVTYVKPMFEAALRGQESEYERERNASIYHAKIVPVRDEHSTIIGGMIVTEDITKRKHAEEALQQSEELLRQLTDRIPQAFWMIKADTGSIIYISPAYETIWGRTCQSLYDNPQSFTDNIHPDDIENVLRERSQNLTNGTYHVDYRVVRPDKTVRWVSSHAYPIYNREGEVIRIAGISEDVTDRKQMEKQVLEFAIQQQNAKLLANFIRDTSHDLRTPLSIINTGLYILRKVTDPQKQAERIDGIEEQVRRMDSVIGDLLKMADLDSLTHLDTALVDVNQVAQEMHSAYANQMTDKNLEFTLSLQPDLPAIQADIDQVRRALAHLIENAIRYTPEGSTIALATALRSNEIVFALQDTGIGIAAEDLDRIFQRFYKVDQARTPGSGGPGMGLAMVKKIAQLHGGSVAVESTLGEGSTFQLKFPVESIQA